MRCQNMFPTLLIIMSSILLHGCGNYPIKFVQTYYGETLDESEMSWVKIGAIYDQHNTRNPIFGELQVKIDSLPQKIFTSRNQAYMFAFPSGKQTIQVKFDYEGARRHYYTNWMKLTRFLEGGKCYAINDYVVDDNVFKMPSKHEFIIEEETGCGTWFPKKGYNRVELYRPGGPEATSPLELIRSYDLDDEIFSSPKLNDSNNRVAILNEFIRRLYKESE